MQSGAANEFRSIGLIDSFEFYSSFCKTYVAAPKNRFFMIVS
jgi:hypothetical protein